MADETKARLRDRRLPQHFWADNEIIDVFGDELGQNGISVYMTMTRFCYGTEVRLSLREIAKAARMSKDTVARSMKVLVALGLVIETKGLRAKTVSIWSLADVKALAKEYIHRSVSETVSQSVSQGDSLKVSSTREPLRPEAQTTLVQLVKEQRANCLTVRQMEKETNQNDLTDSSVDKKICVEQAATDLSQNGAGFETDLSQNEGGHLYCKTQDTKLQNKNYNPLPPSQANGGTAFENENGAKHCGEAVRKVMRELNLTERRMERVIAAAIASYRAKTDDPPNCNAVAELMVRRRSVYLEIAQQGILEYQVGIRKFIALGLWDDTRQWVLGKETPPSLMRWAWALMGLSSG